jgi:hypothetical protein
MKILIFFAFLAIAYAQYVSDGACPENRPVTKNFDIKRVNKKICFTLNHATIIFHSLRMQSGTKFIHINMDLSQAINVGSIP